MPTSPGLAALRARLTGEVDEASRRRAEYSSDASNYRVVPQAVLFPASEADVVAIVEEARRTRTPLTPRGGGTSVAGNAVGPGWIVETSRHLNRVLEIDPVARTARVQPGVVLADLQAAARVHGLRFGPDPSTQSRCTIGGMIGNNACGPRAVAWGRTVDNVVALRIVDGTGRVAEVSAGFDAYPELERVVGRHLATIRTELGRFARQSSGYALEHLLPERGRNLAKALVGTEGTCGILIEATVRLVQIPAATALAVLAYPDTPTAAEDVGALLPLRPAALESMDAELVDRVAAGSGGVPDLPPGGVPDLPPGGAWIFAETTGATEAEALAAAGALVEASSALGSRVLAAGPAARALWRIRQDGVGLAGRTAEGEPAWPGWEDAAVPPAALPAYLREFETLKAQHGVRGLSYGHLGDGCMHTRLDLPLAEDPDRVVRFLEDAADLVVRHGGSLSGEHGDGRARGRLLERMYSPDARAAFAELKAVFDPDGILNPGIVVAPPPLDADLRLPQARHLPARGLALLADSGDVSRAVHRCVGIGNCRADGSAAGAVMCPSYRATRDEKDSTRGRARTLQEMVNGTLVREGWRSPEVAESLDLCLSCRACSSDCPAGVDMAAYKTEMLFNRYRGRLRPAAHYAFGWLPRWLRLASRAPRVVNALARVAALRRLGLRLAGADPRRDVPELPRTTFRAWWARRPVAEPGKPRVALWADTFTDGLSPDIGRAAVAVLEDAGYEVVVPAGEVCCGLTWITTGQLDTARRRLRAAVDALAPLIAEGIPVVGLEPSCTAVLRSDIRDLLPGDARAARIAANTFTLAEFLAAPRAPHAGTWSPPRLDGTAIVAQPHCHHSSVLGWSTDAALLESAGATVSTVIGCCGLAGNWGMERGHYDVSVAVAENGLLPALRNAPDDVFLADGFSCRTQADQLAGREGIHLAQLLASRLSAERAP